MISTPFTWVESGSYITVTDPITSTPVQAYITSLPSASQIFDYWYQSKPLNPNLPYPRLVWSEYLQKFLYSGNWQFSVETSSVILSSTGITWESAVSNSITQDGNITRLCCSDELGKCVAIHTFGEFIPTSSMVYSSDGYNWYTSSFIKPSNNNSNILRDVCWSPETSKFVGIGMSGSGYPYSITSSNGIDWQFTHLTASFPQYYDFRCIAWSPTHNKFVTYGRINVGDGTSRVYTSTDGVSWSFDGSHNLGGIVYSLKEYNGTLIGMGENFGDTNVTITSSLRTSTNLIDWEFKDTKYFLVSDVTYIPQFDKYVITGRSGSLSTNLLTIATSSNLTDWKNFEFPSQYSQKETQYVAWSPPLTRSALITLETNYWSVGNLNYLRSTEDVYANIGFESVPSNDILNTSLAPWTSSITTTFGTDPHTLCWIEYDILVGPDPNNDLYHIPTSSYGIVIDSASLAQFYSYPGYYMEDVDIDGVRYLYEVTQEEGNQYPQYNYGYYETDTFSLRNTDTSTFSASMKSAGRDYVVVYYGVSGDTMGDNVGMVLNLGNGTVEYYEDASNFDAPGSYYLSGHQANDMRFIVPPTLKSEANGFYELSFKVGFRKEQHRSGSLSIT